MKNQNFLKRVGDFVLGKGFYIVLFLCVATIGISGYYLIRSLTQSTPITQPAGGDASVILPDSEANGPDPAGQLPAATQGLTQGGRDSQADQPDDPQPVKKPVEPVEPASASQRPSEPASPVETAPQQPAALVFTWPVKGEILRDFSVEVLSPDPTLGDWRTHGGLDIAAAAGTQVLAMAAGSVSQVFDDGLMGTTVVIDHGAGLTSTYSSLAGQPPVAPGDGVETGTVIGSVGDTAIAESGLSSHLHLEVWLDGAPSDPRDYLPLL